MWVRINELFTRRVKRLSTNCLLGKAAELCLANSWNNSITTTKYVHQVRLTLYSFYHVCWCMHNKRTNCLCVYKHLLTNRLHGKATELCLTNSWNHSVTTTKYIEYINTRVTLSITRISKVYCDVITRSRLQPINTLIDTFFSKLCVFLVKKEGQWWLKGI